MTTKNNTHAADALSASQSEVEALRDELQNWLDNMPENLQGGQKASELEDAISSLESSSVDSLELPESMNDTHVELPVSRRAKSRSDRRDVVVGELSALEAKAREMIDEKRELAETKRGEADAIPGADQEGSDRAEERAAIDKLVEQLEDDANEIESFADEVQNAVSELESVEFPGAR